jgi:hypothetical protein
MAKFIRPERIWLHNSGEYTEKWVQEQIAADPKMLNLGNIILKDKERMQPRAGRLDLLFQDADTNRRFEVELQLGKTDESHLIRTIEYWDVERKRYPQYEHCAVIVAEEITARFLNVINLFNGHIPLVAIQISAWMVGDAMTLIFTKVLDELSLGLVDEDEEVAEVTDRAYWEEQATPKTVAMADEMLKLIRGFDPTYELKYNKFYIGLARNGQPDNFAVFRAKKNNLRLEVRLPQSEETTKKLEGAGVDLMDYDSRWGRYRVRLSPGEVENRKQFLTDVLKQAYDINEA